MHKKEVKQIKQEVSLSLLCQMHKKEVKLGSLSLLYQMHKRKLRQILKEVKNKKDTMKIRKKEMQW